MKAVSIDAVTPGGSVSIFEHNTKLLSKAGIMRGRHARYLPILLESAMVDAGCWYNSFDLIYVSSGPGSFSGVRVGLTMANAIYAAFRKEIRKINSIHAYRAVVGGQVIVPVQVSKSAVIIETPESGEQTISLRELGERAVGRQVLQNCLDSAAIGVLQEMGVLLTESPITLAESMIISQPI